VARQTKRLGVGDARAGPAARQLGSAGLLHFFITQNEAEIRAARKEMGWSAETVRPDSDVVRA
jgi:hypothetical protein